LSSDGLFEAISHPIRINIVQLLAEKPLGFAELKRKLKISSSGLLDFHLKKLDDLIAVNKEGCYSLTDKGLCSVDNC
jgi:predicted transcriptional regulator